MTPTELRVVIYGAGEAGELVVQGLARGHAPNIRPVAFVDDDTRKVGRTLAGLPIEWAGGPIRPFLRKYGAERVLIAIPSAPGRRIREIHRKLMQEEIPALIVPGVWSIVATNDPITTVRDVNPEDFLRRHPRVLEKGKVAAFLKGQRVLVTGAGGTIGMEMVSQLAQFPLEALAGVDLSELAVYRLSEWATGPSWFLADMSRPADVQRVFDRFSPTVVFHAAAYKHVCILDREVRAAVQNNVASTHLLVEAALAGGVHTFVHVSTDKAIRPASIMGATKRAGELIVQAAQDRAPGRRLISVRFGNVLGSSGSVLPKFIEQIERGGPVTVTDPGARRYFMLASEAVELVLSSAAAGRPGKIYILDIGEPMYITELVHDLIRFFGKTPGVDVPIVYTGLGPGEKLKEDLSEIPCRRVDDYLLEVIEDPPELSAVEDQVQGLLAAAEDGEDADLQRRLEQMIPEYADAGTLRASRP